MVRRFRRNPWVSILLGSALSSALGVLLVASLSSAVDDRDLILRVDAAPDEQNGFRHVEALCETSRWFSLDRYETLKEYLEGGIDCSVPADELLKSGTHYLETLDRVLRAPRFQLPDHVGCREVRGSLLATRTMIQLASLQSRSFLEEGRAEDAFERALDILRFAKRVEGADGRHFKIFAITSISKSSGLARLRDLLRRANIDRALLARYGAEVAEYGPEVEGLSRSYRLDYTEDEERIRRIAAGLDPFPDGLFRTGNGWSRWIARFQLRPEMTRKRLAEMNRWYVDNVARFYCDLTPLPRDTWFDKAVNRAGLRFVGKMSPERIDWHYLTWFDVNATHLLFVLRIFKEARGTLPPTLDELVPGFVDELPRDPFDGKALKYDRRKEIVYSVGKDLIDAGGDGRDPWDSDEPVHRIDF